jgi:hypothetical protein
MMILSILAGILFIIGVLSINRYSASANQPNKITLTLPLIYKALMPNVFGVETTDFTTTDGVVTMIKGGATWVRYNYILWSDLQPDENLSPDWSRLATLKQQLEELSKQQVKVILVVRNTPGWAQKYQDSICGPIAENKLPAFAQFMHDLVMQLSASPYDVMYWEIGNEPDAPVRFVTNPDDTYGCWGEPGQSDYGGGYYGQMLKQVYPAIKMADPQAQVLIGGLLLDCDPDHPIYDSQGHLKDCTSSRFLEGILVNGGGDYFDVASYHAYDYFNDLGDYQNPNWIATSYTTGPSSFVKDQFIRSVLAEHGFTNKVLINTETALVCTNPACAENNSVVKINFETTKAYYVAVDYAFAIVNGISTRIWYDIDGTWRNAGLLYNRNPLPAYYAFKIASAELGKAKYSNVLSQYPGIKGYQFTRNNWVIWFLWSIDGKSHTLTLPRPPVFAIDSLGNAVPLSQSMTIDINPRYVEWVGYP